MIKKIQTRNQVGDAVFRTYSDTNHRIRQVATDNIYDDAIDVSDSVEYEEIDEYVDMQGASNYGDVQEIATLIASTARKINYIGLSDNQALSVAELYPSWSSKIGETIEQDYITKHDGKLYRARQTHTALAIYPPSLDTTALYEVVEHQHEGTVDDPIPYTPPMEIYVGKYYSQSDVIYLCTRDSGTALTHDLSALINIYVEPIK